MDNLSPQPAYNPPPEMKSQPVPPGKMNVPLFASAIAVVVGIGIGVLGANSYHANQPYPVQTQPTSVTPVVNSEETANPAAIATESKAADLRVLLNSLFRSHIIHVTNAARRNIQNDPDYQASTNELLRNTNAIAAAIGSVYGPDAEGRFLDTWTRQNEYFMNYAAYVKSGKLEEKEKVVSDLNAYIKEVSLLYNNLSPNLPTEGIHSLVSLQVLTITSAIEAYAVKDYSSSYGKENEAANQAANIADTLSTSIVKQYPEKF